MNFIEAVKLAEKSNKIRRNMWCSSEYIHCTGVNYFLDEKNNQYLIVQQDVLGSDWEIYEENPKFKTYTFIEALTALGNDKMITRVRNSGVTIHIDRAYADNESILFNFDDVHAEDWRIIDK